MTLDELKCAVEALTFAERVKLDAYLWSTMPNVRYSSATVEEKMRELTEGREIPQPK